MNSFHDTITETDLLKIQKNVKILAKNQDSLAHVIKESISVLNVSQLEMSENRKQITTLNAVSGLL